jgi:hypothetical protein
MWRMSKRTPDGSAPCAASGTRTGGRSAFATATGSIGMTGDAQHPHVQRTQNAGQPLSGPDSLAPTPQFSGTPSELRPLASANSTANSAMRRARRIRPIVYHATPILRAETWLQIGVNEPARLVPYQCMMPDLPIACSLTPAALNARKARAAFGSVEACAELRGAPTGPSPGVRPDRAPGGINYLLVTLKPGERWMYEPPTARTT